MRSFLHELAAARTDIGIVWWVLFAVIVGGCTARAEESPEAQARAALALAKAQRERTAMGCHTDVLAARLEASRTNRPLVYWVNLTCADHAELRRDLKDAVHCHLKEWNNDASPRLIFFDGEGTEWFVPPNKLRPELARHIRSKWQTPMRRTNVGIEER